jgi:DNA-binding NarL/FixJ family response regulator
MLDEGDDRLAHAGIQYGADWLVWIRALLLEAEADAAAALDLLEVAFRGAEGMRAGAAMSLFAFDLARLAVPAGRVDLARDASAALWPHPSPVPPNVEADRVAIDGLITASAARLADAAERQRAAGHPSRAAIVEELLAAQLARDGQVGAARDVLRACVETHNATGAVWLAERAVRLAAEAGVVLRGRPPRRAPAVGPESLTATERLVVELVVTGRSNPDIAAELGISRRTVESHLRRVFVKLDVTNRTQLTASLLRS